MAPLTKDAAETGSSASETTVSQTTSQPAAQTKSSGGHQRSDAVSLEVPIKVHGSRVTQMVRGVTPHTEPFEEETSTMIVFPQGGVLRMNTSVSTGQMLVLTNLKSKQDAICRVLKVRSFPNMQAYVEVEFTQSQKGYWGVYFPGEGSTPLSTPAKSASTVAHSTAQPEKPKVSPVTPSSPAPSASAQKLVEPVPQSKEVKPVIPAVPPPPPPPVRPASVFASIGTKEDVQIAADSTREPRTSHVASTIEKEIRAAQPAKPAKQTPILEETLAPAATALSLEELRGDEDAISSVLASLDGEEKSSSASKSVATAKSPRESAAPTFGARLDLGVATGTSEGAEPSQNWLMIGACIAVLFLAVGGGIMYFRVKPPNSPAVQAPVSSEPAATRQVSTPAATQQALTQPTQAQTVQSSPAPSRATQAPPAAPSVSANSNPSRTNRIAAPAPQQTTTVVVEQPAQQTQPAVPNPLATAMDAHPVSSQRAVTTSAAPTLDPAANLSSQPGELPGVGSDSVAAPPPPEPVSDAPKHVGGKIQQPRLISSVMPMYPSVAKQAHVEGDVVVDTEIDKNGKVVQTKAVSGPVVLRQAAVDAVRRWKYQPSTLDGQPVPVQMLVTVKFRL